MNVPLLLLLKACGRPLLFRFNFCERIKTLATTNPNCTLCGAYPPAVAPSQRLQPPYPLSLIDDVDSVREG